MICKSIMDNNIINSFMEIIKIGYVFNMKSGINISETIITSLFFILLSGIFTNERLMKKILDIVFEFFNFTSYNCVVLEGKRCFRMTDYNSRSDQLFSTRFKAVWHYLIKNNDNNLTIHSIKEFADSSNIYDEHGDSYKSNRSNKIFGSKNKLLDIFIVNQTRNFLLYEDIYCSVVFDNEKIESKKSNKENTSNIETIKLNIFSYKKSLLFIRDFIDNLTLDFISEIQNVRINKRFIYSFIGRNEKKNDYDYDYDKYDVWEECEFLSARNFKNLFFENKQLLINKLQFFNNNKDWYDKEGHPWTFGLGLSGPPGTGKTSIIKCIANMLNRHLIVIPLNKIKTQREFSQYYFENRYNKNNEPDSIGFDNKIIVFEDIDCMTDIVKKRVSIVEEDNSIIYTNSINSRNSTNILLKKLIKKIKDNDLDNCNASFLKEVDNDFTLINKNTTDDALTLSYLLNIIDGIRETPGRILIITSNNYDSLDDALVRPGRIDFTLKMDNASVKTIHEMFEHYYGCSLHDYYSDKESSRLKILQDNILSPAEIVNIHLYSKTPDDFIFNLINIFEKKNKN